MDETSWSTYLKILLRYLIHLVWYFETFKSYCSLYRNFKKVIQKRVSIKPSFSFSLKPKKVNFWDSQFFIASENKSITLIKFSCQLWPYPLFKFRSRSIILLTELYSNKFLPKDFLKLYDYSKSELGDLNKKVKGFNKDNN